jgi:NAD(P)-dependent dehydrogenase (short-subunit alcohol dehydrogenase family)
MENGARIVLITGANRGIGKATAKLVAATGARVIMACRNVSRSLAAADEVRRAAGRRAARVDLLELDLASIDSITAFAESVKTGYERIDTLINNAGLFSKAPSRTKDGFELTMGTNFLGPFLLTNLLLPLLRKSPDPRIVNLSSSAFRFGNISRIPVNPIKPYHGFLSYASSKLAMLLFTLELALKAKGIAVNAIHPGIIDTGIQKLHKWYDVLVDAVFAPFRVTEEEGAVHCARLAVSDEMKGITGRYFHLGTMRGIPRRLLAAVRRESVWERSASLVGLA